MPIVLVTNNTPLDSPNTIGSGLTLSRQIRMIPSFPPFAKLAAGQAREPIITVSAVLIPSLDSLLFSASSDVIVMLRVQPFRFRRL